MWWSILGARRRKREDGRPTLILKASVLRVVPRAVYRLRINLAHGGIALDTQWRSHESFICSSVDECSSLLLLEFNASHI